MVSVSSTYKPYADVRRCDILAVFEMLDVSADTAASHSASNQCALSQLTQTHDRIEGMSAKVATLEQDYFMLDGTFSLPNPSALGQTGFWCSVISGANGNFTTPPTLTFTWTANRSSAGFTVCFDDKAEEFPSAFKVYAYDLNGTLLKSKTVQNSAVRCIVDMPTENYRKLVFEFISTSKPYRRVRVAEVLFGVVQQFNRDNTAAASLETAFAPDCAALPSTEFTLTVDNSSKAWNMANPQGIYAYLQQSQPLKLWMVINGEQVYMGTYYFTSATAEDDALTAKITAHDKLYSLDSVVYRGAVSASWTLSQAVAAVLSYANVGLSTNIPTALASRQVSGAIPEDTSCREALRLISQAARAACYINRDGVLAFFDPLTAKAIVDALNFDNMAAMPKISVAEKINTVELTVNEDNIYTAANVGVDEPVRVKAYTNALVLPSGGNAAAQYLLSLAARRFNFKLQERGNPARDIADFVTVRDPYGGTQTAMITRHKLDFDGGLKCETDAVGVN